MKSLLLLCCLLLSTVAFAQKTDSERIKVTFTQYPQTPFEASVKSYGVKVINTTNVVFNTVEVTNKLRIEGFKYDQEHPEVLVVLAIDKINLSEKVFSEVPPKDPATPNVTPQTMWFYKVDMIMEASMRILTTDMKYEYYPHKFEPMTTSMKSEPFPTEGNAKKALTLFDPAVPLTSYMSQATLNYRDYVNRAFGYTKGTQGVAICTIKSKDFDYADMDQALTKYKSAMESFSANGLNDDNKKLLDEAITIWEKNAGENKGDDKKAKINSKNITEIYLNLVAGNIWRNNFADAQKYLDLSANEKGNNSEKLQLNQLIIDRKPAYEQNLLREQNKLTIDKKFSNLYVAPDFKVTTHAYRIKADIVSVSGGGSRRIFEYDNNGLLVRTYVQRMDAGIYKHTDQVDSVIYDHQNLTMSTYNVKEKRVTSTETVKDGRVVSTTGDIGNYVIRYGKNGRLTGYTKTLDGKKEVTTYTYDKDKIKTIVQKDILTGKDSVVNYTINFTWDGDKLMSTDGKYVHKYQYGANGHVAGETYDDFGNITKITEGMDDGSKYVKLFEWEKGSGNVTLFKTSYPFTAPSPMTAPRVY